MDGNTLILICIAVALIAIALIGPVVRRGEFVASFRNIPGPPSLPLFGNALQLNGSPSGKLGPVLYDGYTRQPPAT